MIIEINNVEKKYIILLEILFVKNVEKKGIKKKIINI